MSFILSICICYLSTDILVAVTMIEEELAIKDVYDKNEMMVSKGRSQIQNAIIQTFWDNIDVTPIFCGACWVNIRYTKP